MLVTVKYSAQLRQAAGVPREQLDVPSACSIRDLLAAAARKNEALRAQLLDSSGAPRPHLLICVGDEQVTAGTVLKDGDEVTLLSPIAGG
jgi:molybdopterin converting factor small subunit